MRKYQELWLSLALLAAYVLFGYFAGPPLVQSRLEHYVASQLGRELHFDRLRVNPLALSVRLDTVELIEGDRSLWPGLSISADEIDLRFSFWRLSPVVTELTVRAPDLMVNTGAGQLQAGRYPFVGLWQQWQQTNNTVPERKPISVKNWRLENGRVVISEPASPAPAKILLDNIFLQAVPQNPDGLHEFSLAFAVNGKVDIKTQGLFNPKDLSATGKYQMEMPNAADSNTTGLAAAGTFSGNLLADEILIELSESQLSAEHFASCMLDGLLCAGIAPLQAGFESRLLAGSDGVRVAQAYARLNAFQLDASLGRGRVAFADQQRFYGAQIELSLPQATSPVRADENANQNFILWLNGSDTNQYRIEGQMNLQSQATETQFQISGMQRANGTAQLRRVDQLQAQTASAQLKLQLENPGAGMGQEFMNEHFNKGLEAQSLQFQLVATLDEPGLKLQENVGLQKTRLAQASGQQAQAAFGTETDASLDAEWLIALLQDPNDLIQFEIPELTADSTIDSNLSEFVQRQVLAMLTELSAQPFTGLAQALQIDNQNLNEISFAPGSAALDAANTNTIADLASILLQRPGLGVSLAGVYDLSLDKKALQTEQVRTHIALATAADLAFRTGAQPPDFSDPVVHSVIDEFARQQVPAEIMQDFTGSYGQADADRGILPEGDAETYYSRLFELLVDYAEVPQGAMTNLARYRAQAVIDGLEDGGISRERLETAAQPASTEAREASIPLPLQLQIWRGEITDVAPETAPALLPETDTDRQD